MIPPGTSFYILAFGFPSTIKHSIFPSLFADRRFLQQWKHLTFLLQTLHLKTSPLRTTARRLLRTTARRLLYPTAKSLLPTARRLLHLTAKSPLPTATRLLYPKAKSLLHPTTKNVHQATKSLHPAAKNDLRMRNKAHKRRLPNPPTHLHLWNESHPRLKHVGNYWQKNSNQLPQ